MLNNVSKSNKNHRINLSRSGLTQLITTKTMFRLDDALYFIYLSLQPRKNDKIPFVVVGKRSSKKRCNIVSSKAEFEKLFMVIVQLIKAFREKLDTADPNYNDVEDGFKLIESGWDGYEKSYKKYYNAILKKPESPKTPNQPKKSSSPQHGNKSIQQLQEASKDSTTISPVKTRLQRSYTDVHMNETSPTQVTRNLSTQKHFKQNTDADANEDLLDIQQNKKLKMGNFEPSIYSNGDQQQESGLDMLKILAEQVLITKQSDPKIVTNIPHFIIDDSAAPSSPGSPESLSSIENGFLESTERIHSNTSNKRKRDSIFEIIKMNSNIPVNDIRNELKRMKTRKDRLMIEIESIKKMLQEKQDEIEEIEFNEKFLKKLKE